MKTKTTFLSLLFISVLLITTSSLNAQIFTNPIPIPYQMSGNSFSININSADHNFDPNGFLDDINLNVSLPAFCYNQTGNTGMTYLGPTLVFNKGMNHSFDITNNLPSNIKTTVHWHGLNIPAKMDGGPHQVINNGSTWQPNFTVIDPVQTIWYHTHLLDQTTDQVVRGLAGMILVEDENDPLESQLPNNYGENDFPIIIQEKGFVLDSTTTPPTATAIKAGEKPGNGPYTLINGVVGGVLRVPPEIVRLRILNGSPRKMFNIGLSSELIKPTSFATMWMVATGGGYIDFPRPVDSTMMSIGDRREFLVDFSQWAHGDTIYMSNLSVPIDALYTDNKNSSIRGNAFMAFIVDDAIFPQDPITSIPATLKAYSLDPGTVFKERTKRLMGAGHSGGIWTIDGTPMKLDVINDTVLVNTKERWTIINETNKAHPFHIHKVQFQVIEYTGKVGASNEVKTYTYPDLPDDLIGYKDVQLIRDSATLVFEARFDSFPSPLLATEGFMYHCHILTHEDTSMMHQFVVVDSIGFHTGITSIPGIEELHVYPNPASNMLTFNSNFNQSGILRFFDLSGRIIHQVDITSLEDTSVLVHDLPRGLIILEFISGERRYVQKVILH